MKSLFDVVLRPVISEKADTSRETKGTYVFEVHPDANKVEVKQAIESLFKVNVEQVRTVVVRGKIKRVGRTMGQAKNWKKAYVTLAEGQTIDLFETA